MNTLKEPHSRSKFKELASKRVNQAAKIISNIGNLSNRTNYSYEDKEVKKIFSYLRNCLKDAEKRFETMGPKGECGFKL